MLLADSQGGTSQGFQVSSRDSRSHSVSLGFSSAVTSTCALRAAVRPASGGSILAASAATALPRRDGV